MPGEFAGMSYIGILTAIAATRRWRGDATRTATFAIAPMIGYWELGEPFRRLFGCHRQDCTAVGFSTDLGW